MTPEQVDALRSLPLGSLQNKVSVAIGMLRRSGTKVRYADIEEATGLKQAHLSDIVRGRQNTVTVDTAHKLAEFFGCAIEDLFPAREAVAS